MPATIQHVHTATTPDITAGNSYDILPQRDWNATHAATLSLAGSEVIPAFTNQGNVTFGIGNAGLISATCAAIILSAGSQIASGGTVSFANSNNVSFGLNGSTLTASVAAVPSLAVSAGSNSQNSGTINFANSNGVTFGMDTAGNVTATVQPGPAAGVGGVIAGSQTLTIGTMSFVNSNGISFGLSNSTNLTASYTVPAQSAQTQNLHDLTINGNTEGAAQLISSGTLVLGGGSNITLSQNGQSISIIGNPAQTVQTQNCVDVSLAGNVAGGLALISSGTAIFAGGANVTLSQNGQSISILAAGAGGAAIAGIAGSNGTYITGTVLFGNQNGISFGTQTGNAITASYTVPNVPVVPGALSGVGGSITSGTAQFSNSNNVSFGFNGQTITASAGPAYDVTLAGNTTGTLALISSGTMTLAGGANITLSQNGNAVTISGAAGGGGGATFSGGLSNIGNTAGNTGTVSGQLVLAGGNNVTLSGSTNAGSITITVSGAATLPSVGLSAGTQSVNSGTVSFANSNGVSFGMSGSQTITASVAAQSNQTLGMYAESNTTGQSSSLAIDARSLSLDFIGLGLSGGFSNGSLIFSHVQTNQAMSLYALSNTVGQSSSSTFVATNLSSAFAGAISGGMSNGSILFSVPNQSNQSLAIYATSQTTGQSSSSSYDARSLTLNFAGAASGGWSNGSLLVSVAAGAQTNQTLGLYGISNTTGASSSITVDARSVSFEGAGAISVGGSNGSWIISAPGTVALTQFSGGMSTGGNTVGTTGLATAQLVLAGGANVTLSGSTNAGSMTITVSAGSGNTGGTAYATGNTVANSSGTFALSSLLFNALGAQTVAFSNGSIELSCPVTSLLSGVNGISVSSNGSTISISLQPTYLSRSLNLINQLTEVTAPGNASASVVYWPAQACVTATRLDMLLSWSGASSATAATGAIAISAYAAIYTKNASTLSSVSSGSTQTTYTYASNSAGQTQLIGGAVRPISVPINVNMFPGEYYIGVNLITATSSVGTATTNYGQTISMMGGNLQQTALNYAEFTAATATSTGLYGGMGVYSAATTGLPIAISLSALNQTGSALSAANIGLALRNV